MNHALASLRFDARLAAMIAACRHRIAGWLARRWLAACRRAESSRRVVPDY